MVEWGIPVIALLLLSFAIGSETQQRCATTIAANWFACTAFVELSGNYTPWVWFWAMDFLSAVAVTLQPHCRVQRALVYSYIFQIGFHAGFGLTHAGDAPRYLGALDTILICQMLLVFVWTAAHGLRDRDSFRRIRPLHFEARP